jgi:hypothetical protein
VSAIHAGRSPRHRHQLDVAQPDAQRACETPRRRLGARRLRRVVGFSLLIVGVLPAVAYGGVGIGAATRFRARFTTDHTAAPTGLVLSTSGRLPAPGVLEAPAVRQTVILPQGIKLRLERLPQCHASDAAIAADGAEGACPRSSRVGRGQADGVLSGSPADFALAIYAVRGHLVFAAEQGHKPLKQSFTGVGQGRELILTVPTLDGQIAPPRSPRRSPPAPAAGSGC